MAENTDQTNAAAIALVHPEGCEVSIILPADMETVGETLRVLGAMGYTLPAAEGATSMSMGVTFNDSEKGRITWRDVPERNERIYKHHGCVEGGRWIVPLDDCPPPTADTAECARCYIRFPLVPAVETS